MTMPGKGTEGKRNEGEKQRNIEILWH